jgi:hypothetical protein
LDLSLIRLGAAKNGKLTPSDFSGLVRDSPKRFGFLKRGQTDKSGTTAQVIVSDTGFMKHLPLVFWLVCATCELCATGLAYGHGFAGARFFPATLSTDDPFIADELSFPTISTIRTPNDGGTRKSDISVDIAKRITPDFGIEIGETLTVLNPHEQRAANGFGNLELGGKYQLLKNGPHEAIVSLGLGVEIGGTGSRSIGADSFSTWAPGIFFGKGFGDLPEALRCLKPFAITGQAGIEIPTSASTRSVTMDDRTGETDVEIERHSDVLEWGFALE